MRTALSLTIRIALLLAGLTLVWRATMAVTGYQGPRDTALHLGTGLAISIATFALLAVLVRFDRLPLRDIGTQRIAGNLRAFAIGAGLWLVPALAGTAVCLALGWTTIAPRSSATGLAIAIPLLALGVFLIEALPEELAFRGYVQGLVGRRAPAWVALLVQLGAFTTFAWAIGALDSVRQWMFIPGFALILGYARAMSANAWTAIGIHAAWMTTQQALAMHADVTGMQTLQFLAFALLPSATLGVVLGVRHADFDWRRPATPA